METPEQPARRETRITCSYCSNVGHNSANSRCPKKLELFTKLYSFYRIENTNEQVTELANEFTGTDVKYCCKELGIVLPNPAITGTIPQPSLREKLLESILQTRLSIMESIPMYPQFAEYNDVAALYLPQYIVNGSLNDTFYELPVARKNYIRRVVYEFHTVRLRPVMARARIPGDNSFVSHCGYVYKILMAMHSAFQTSETQRLILENQRYPSPDMILPDGVTDRTASRVQAIINATGVSTPVASRIDEIVNAVLPAGLTYSIASRARAIVNGRLANAIVLARTPVLRKNRKWGIDIKIEEKEEQTIFDCNICYEVTPTRFEAQLACGHKFCFLCIQQQMNLHKDNDKHPCCGMCREPIKSLGVRSDAMSKNFEKFARLVKN